MNGPTDPRLGRAQRCLEAAAASLAADDAAAAVHQLDDLLAEGGWPPTVEQVVAHNLVGALRQAARLRLQAGAPAEAEQHVQRMLQVILPADTPDAMRRHRAEFFTGIAADFIAARHPAQAALCQRAAIAIHPCPTFQNNLISALSDLRQPSQLSDYAAGLEVSDLAPHLLIVAQPKSASTFLKNLLAEASGFRDTYLFHAAELASQDLFYPVLLELAEQPTVTHQHLRATEANLQIMQAFGLRAVVLTRPLADVLVSLSEFLTAGAIRGTQFDLDAWMRATPERRIDQLIDLVVPWHLEFLAGWQRADRTRRVPVMWLDYAQVTGDPVGSARRLFAFHGIQVDEARLQQALARVVARPAAENRIQQGRAGRGGLLLSAAQQERLRRLASYYPDTDFAPYGLT